jgi:hypothetical protein
MGQRIKKSIATGATLLTLGAGGTIAVDSQINPYTDMGDRQAMAIAQDLPEAGEAKVELIKERPEVRLKKWSGEVDLGVRYDGVKSAGSRALLTNRMEWKSQKEEVHAYPKDNGDFEIEVVLKEKPKTNKFDFQLDGYQDLDFFYQPALTPEEIEQGAERPENVVGSYAVYHKSKSNHVIGKTNYATGKAFHIYRPKAIDANGNEVWATLDYKNGVLSVTVPQEFLNTAVYPVLVDPTFGYNTIGGSTERIADRYGSNASDSDHVRVGYTLEGVSGQVTAITAYLGQYESGNAKASVVINQKDGGGANTHTQVGDYSERNDIPMAEDWRVFNYSATISDGNNYILNIVGDGSSLPFSSYNELYTYYDEVMSGPTNDYYMTYPYPSYSVESPWVASPKGNYDYDGWSDFEGYTFPLNFIVNNNGLVYKCKLSHLWDANKEPGVSPGWQTYWEELPSKKQYSIYATYTEVGEPPAATPIYEDFWDDE